VFAGLKTTDQFGEPLLVGVTGGAIAIRLDPFWMLNTQVMVNSLLELGIRARKPSAPCNWLNER
jgi:hypothetical protein